AEIVLKIMHEIARASGSMGMVGGQAVDIESQGKNIDFPLLEYMHIHKTGALILAAIKSGAILSSASEKEMEALTRYGEAIGLAFQITDDILDIEGSKETMGKEKGSDINKEKATYPSILGIEDSKKRAEELVAIALSSVNSLGEEADPLRYLAKYIIDREG
ncbi:MAG: polyprenyl synthetase family protein, partial [Thermodesulfobacteriota bacterium]